MSSNPIQIYAPCLKDKNKSDSPGITNLSPITNLTLNLSGLSTANSGTPIRRISWSNPICNESRINIHRQDCADSPTFQEIFPRRGKIKHRVRKCISKIIPSDSDDDKENIVPHNHYYEGSSLSKKSEDSIPCSSQDSGYSGSHYLESPLSPLPTCKISFTDDEDDTDGFENIFELKEGDSVDCPSPIPMGMSHLLTKPLLKPLNGHLSPSTKRHGKLPIRRCLSMEMDSESDSSSSESTSKRETFIAPLNSQRKFYASDTKNVFKRPEPPINNLMSYSKRRKSSPSVHDKSPDNFIFQRSYSETAATIMHALLKADLQPELVGDGSRSYALPLCKGRHEDLKSITPGTLVELLKGNYKNHIENFVLVDCRYPYEYEGGHIQGAKNIFTKDDIVAAFFDTYTCNNQKNAIIFHCEFSSERAPTLCRFLRRKDREVNEGHYPRLHHPETYILEGGYKAFFEEYREYCQPQDYKPMNHKDHGFELRHFRAKSKSWGSDCKGRSKFRSNSKPELI